MAKIAHIRLPAFGDLTQAQRRMTRYVLTHPTYKPRSGPKQAVFERLVTAHVLLEDDDGTHRLNPNFKFQTWNPDTKQWTDE